MCEQMREHLRQGLIDQEHRAVTMGFIEFSGTDQLLSEAGDDGLVAALEELMVRVQESAHDHGVTILSTDVAENGGKVILTAGVPVAAGDDETRLLATLIRVTGARLTLPVRAGARPVARCSRATTGRPTAKPIL